MSVRRVVACFDTNILVRLALSKTSASQRMWDAFTDGQFGLLISESILAEVNRVLHYNRIATRHKLTEEHIQNFLRVLVAQAVITQDLYEVARVHADPTDNIFLACALEGEADYLVSEDPHLREIENYHGVQIIGLAKFQKIVGL